MKPTNKKLTLNRETLRALGGDNLRRVVGGRGDDDIIRPPDDIIRPTNSCPITQCGCLSDNCGPISGGDCISSACGGTKLA